MKTILEEGKQFLLVTNNADVVINEEINWIVIIYCLIVFLLALTLLIKNLKNKKSAYQFVTTIIFSILIIGLSIQKFINDCYYIVGLKQLIYNPSIIVIKIVSLLITFALFSYYIGHKERKIINNVLITIIYINLLANHILTITYLI